MSAEALAAAIGPRRPSAVATRRRLVHVGVRLVVLLAVVLLVALGVGPFTGAYRTLNVLSSSMAPTIPAGAVIFVTPEPPESLAAGQIVTFSPPGTQRVITHRVLEVIEPGPQPIIRTIGDANAEPDPWTAQLDGRPVWRTRIAVPYLGYLVTWLRSPVPRTVALYLAPALFVVLQLRRLWRPVPASAVGAAAPRAPASAAAAEATSARPGQPARRRSRRGTTRVALVALGVGLTSWAAAPAALAAFGTTTSAAQAMSTGTLVPPSSLTGTSSSCPHTITLTWPAATGTIATGYRILRGGTPIANVAGVATTTYADSGLARNTQYTYTIHATRGGWVSATNVGTGGVRTTTANC